ncbi:Uncharacterised protein [Actinobacillus pleuropneumoniae]|nr:Uncharacterised protein [Actinobacillus pleuropneumoniae]
MEAERSIHIPPTEGITGFYRIHGLRCRCLMRDDLICHGRPSVAVERHGFREIDREMDLRLIPCTIGYDEIESPFRVNPVSALERLLIERCAPFIEEDLKLPIILAAIRHACNQRCGLVDLKIGLDRFAASDSTTSLYWPSLRIVVPLAKGCPSRFPCHGLYRRHFVIINPSIHNPAYPGFRLCHVDGNAGYAAAFVMIASDICKRIRANKIGIRCISKGTILMKRYLSMSRQIHDVGDHGIGIIFRTPGAGTLNTVDSAVV